MSIDKWSRTAADNDDASKDAMIEGMDRDQVNDQSRAQQASLRTWYEDGEWVELLNENNASFTFLRANDTTFDVTDDTGTDASGKFPAGTWVRVTGSGGSLVTQGYVVSAIYDTIDTTVVTLAGIIDNSYASAVLPTGLTAIETYFNRRAREAAFHPVGTTRLETPTQIPDIDSMGTHVTKAEGSGGGIDADTVDSLHASAFALAGAVDVNQVVNSGMQIWQRGTSFTTPADTDYVADRWKVLVEGATWDVSRDTSDVPSGFQYALALTGNGASNDMVGILHVLTAADSRLIIDNGTASLTYKIKLHTSYTVDKVRAGILEWRGAPDSPSSDPVLTWNAEDTDPSLNANWFYANTPSADEVTKDASWQTITVENVSINSSTENLAVFIWTNDDSHGASDVVRITGVKIEAGASATSVSARKFAEEMALCLPHYQKTYDYGTKPGTASSLNGQIVHPTRGLSIGLEDCSMDWRFHVPMFAVPTVTPYSPDSGVSGKAYDTTGLEPDCVAENPGTGGVTLFIDDDPSNAVPISVHGTAEAEL